MPLTDAQIDEFYREGYLLLPGLVPTAAAEAVLAAAPQGLGASGRWEARIFDHDEPTKDAPIHDLLVERTVVEAVEALFGGPARVWYGMLAVVKAGGGHGLPWHQDNQYTHLLGPALNVFIALTPVSPERAGLWIAPRSHRFGRQPSVRNETTAPGYREAAVEPENGFPLPPMQPGDVCIFDRNTYHRSVQNLTDQDRYAYAAQYLAENTRLAETGEKDPRRMLVSELGEALGVRR
jgi:ectoine hydroxylase-related dioxygenase (phytanoyl-CoA dioxygenase family)